MWIFGKKFSEKTKKHFASMKETWETDKNELALCSGNIYIHGKTDIHGKRYNPLSVGYQIQTLEIFSDIVPVSLDIMEALLKDCFVFTHIYNAIDKPPKKKD